MRLIAGRGAAGSMAKVPGEAPGAVRGLMRGCRFLRRFVLVVMAVSFESKR